MASTKAQTKYRQARPEYYADWHRQRKYGMYPGQYQAMYEEQKGLCYICQRPPRGSKPLCVDHNHNTGEVRKLLCHHYNVALGCVNESEELLLQLISYLREHNVDDLQEEISDDS